MTKALFRPLFKLHIRDGILKASLDAPPRGISASDARVWRWFPWLISFTGLRPTEIIASKGQDYLFSAPGTDEDIPSVRRPQAKSFEVWPAPLHPALIEMGLLEMAGEHKDAHPFLPGDASPSEATAALKRYVRKLQNAGLLADLEAPVMAGMRQCFVRELVRVGTNSDIIHLLLGRRTEPSKFDDGTTQFTSGACAISKLELPKDI